METTTEFAAPKDVDDVTASFPATVIGTLLPRLEDIPEEFRRNWTTNEMCRAASKLFFSGGVLPAFRDDIDRSAAARHLQAVLGSFEPQHEHKIAGAGYLLSLWT